MVDLFTRHRAVFLVEISPNGEDDLRAIGKILGCRHFDTSVMDNSTNRVQGGVSFLD